MQPLDSSAPVTPVPSSEVPSLVPTPEPQVVQDNRDQDLVMGNYRFKKIAYSDLQPGDIVCTYEGASTLPGIVRTIELQKILGKKGLDRMLHFEIILEKLPRDGMYKIAQANGLSKKVEASNENFKQYNSGQAIVVFRPVANGIASPLAKKIVEIAQETSNNKGLTWKIKIITAIDSRNWRKLLKHAWKAVKFSVSPDDEYKDKSLRKLARMAVDFHNHKTFLTKKGSPMGMSCVEYAANVLNVSLISVAYEAILADIHLDDQEKIERIVSIVKNTKFNLTLPSPTYKFSETGVNSADFVDFLYRNDQDFSAVGYLGTRCSPDVEREPVIVPLSNKPVTAEQMTDLITGTAGSIDTVAPQTTAQVLQTLNILSTSGHINMEVGSRDVKLKSAFLYLYAEQRNLNFDDLSRVFTDPRCMDVLNTFPGDYRQKSEALKNIVDAQAIRINESRKKSLFHIPHTKGEYTQIHEALGEINIGKKGELEQYLIKNGALKDGVIVEAKIYQVFREFYSEVQSVNHRLSKETILHCVTDAGVKDFADLEAKFLGFNERFLNLVADRQAPLKGEEKKRGVNAITFEFLNPRKKMDVVRIWKKLISATPDSRAKQDELALASLNQKAAVGALRSVFGYKIIKVGLALLVLPPVGLLFLAVGACVKWSGDRIQTFYDEWQKRFVYLRSKNAPDANLVLVKQIENERRPWLHYTLDDGKTWFDEPFILEEGSKDRWIVKFDKKNQAMKYKIFLGPEDIKHPDPFHNVDRWQKTTNNDDVVVRKEELMVDRFGVTKLPDCENPEWA